MKCDRDESGTEYGGIEHEHIKLLSLSSPPTAPLPPCRVIIPAHGPTQDSCHHKAPRCAFSSHIVQLVSPLVVACTGRYESVFASEH